MDLGVFLLITIMYLKTEIQTIHQNPSQKISNYLNKLYFKFNLVAFNTNMNLM